MRIWVAVESTTQAPDWEFCFCSAGLAGSKWPDEMGALRLIDLSLEAPYMDLFEYQGKQFFASFRIPVSAGEATDNVDEAVAIASSIGYPVVIKAQVQVGGRGKAGGVKLANDAAEAHEHAVNILGLDIGHIVKIVDEGGLRYRRGVLRQLHVGPCGEEASRDALGRGRC